MHLAPEGKQPLERLRAPNDPPKSVIDGFTGRPQAGKLFRLVEFGLVDDDVCPLLHTPNMK